MGYLEDVNRESSRVVGRDVIIDGGRWEVPSSVDVGAVNVGVVVVVVVVVDIDAVAGTNVGR